MGLRNIGLRLLGAHTELEYEDIISNQEDQIITLKDMLREQHEGHINEMKGINNKLDFVVEAYKKQEEDMQAVTKELLWQREEALVWRERLETKLEIDAERLSPPQALIDIEKKRNDKKRSTKA